jgi:hypothetical protein
MVMEFADGGDLYTYIRRNVINKDNNQNKTTKLIQNKYVAPTRCRSLTDRNEKYCTVMNSPR